ncbi:hypothetical protein CXF59_02405 [Flavobacterium sp. ALD4]|uniref:hypothetical protein n=1 Tax=Flavobacterium sp. ALD4 TaxID=2058314 RepID=UPI000C33AE4D|nr:hypothetical protein [Flavobacterium sp. ALD4]PKH69131.1 hypothetical protein CXF59_02405 [Flavobacterium sp. ALD4]
MKKYLLFIALVASSQIFAQEFYMYSGSNITAYKYKVGDRKMNSSLQSGSGSFYEAGLINPFIGNRVFYSVGVSVDDYNAIGSTNTSSYSWDTKFIGVDSGVLFSLFPHKLKPVKALAKGRDNEAKTAKDQNGKDKLIKIQADGGGYKAFSLRRFDVLLIAGAKVATIVYGKQQIDGVYYDLLKDKEFSGVLIGSNLGMKIKYNVSPRVATSVGYNFFQSFNFSNKTEEKLSFNTNQVQFGLHFNIN